MTIGEGRLSFLLERALFAEQDRLAVLVPLSELLGQLIDFGLFVAERALGCRAVLGRAVRRQLLVWWLGRGRQRAEVLATAESNGGGVRQHV